MIVRQPGKVPAGEISTALQTLVDYAYFLSAADIKIPYSMTGKDQTGVWYNYDNIKRDHVMVENRHEPTTIHLKTYIEDRYKITVYYNQSYGELFDLETDPEELHNLWDDPNSIELKSDLIPDFCPPNSGLSPYRCHVSRCLTCVELSISSRSD